MFSQEIKQLYFVLNFTKVLRRLDIQAFQAKQTFISFNQKEILK